ncbi:MAG: sensor histidine kinase [Sarcina sp.]
MMLYRNKIEINKNKLVLRVVIIFIYIVAILFFNHEKDFEFLRIIEVMEIVFISSIVMMVNNKYSRSNSNVSVNLIFGLMVILILKIIKFLLLDMNIINSMYNIQLEMISLVINWVEFSIVINIIKKSIKKKKIINKIFNMIKFSIFMILLLAIICLMVNNEQVVFFIKNFYYNYGLNYIVSITIYILTIADISKMNFPMDKRERKTLFVFINLIFFSSFTIGFYPKTMVLGINREPLFIALSLEYFAYYGLYEGIIINSLEFYYKNLYDYIVTREKNIKQRNTISKNRTKLLMELNRLIEKSRKHHNELINSVNDFICIFKGTKIEYINETAINFVRGSFDKEYLTEKLSDFCKTHILKKIEKEGLVEAKFDLNLIDKFDEIINLELYYLNLTNGYSFLLIRNMTEQKRLKEKGEYLKRFYEEEYLKSRFFSNISHELKTPINVIYSAIQLNEINLEEKNLKKVVENNKRIRQNSLRLIRTINNFIDVNRISENFLSGEYKTHNIVELVETILEQSEKYLSKKEMNFIFDTEKEEIFARIDRVFTERVILNILSNCVKYGKKDGYVFVKIALDGENININIENNGKLITDEEKAYIFDKFTKNNKSLNRDNEGSGLGLYISKSIMKLQGGSLEIAKNKNDKNVFIVSFKSEKINGLEFIMNNKGYSENYISDLKERIDIEFADIYL